MTLTLAIVVTIGFHNLKLVVQKVPEMEDCFGV